jgi:hypothetical protein
LKSIHLTPFFLRRVGFVKLLLLVVIGCSFYGTVALAHNVPSACRSFYRGSTALVESILQKVEIPKGMNRPKIILVAAHEDSEFQRAREFYSKHGIVVWRVTFDELQAIQRTPIPETPRFPLFGLLRMDSQVTMFSHNHEGQWAGFWGGVAAWRVKYKDEDLSIFAYYYLLNRKTTDNVHVKQSLRAPVDLRNDPWRDYYQANPLFKSLQGTWIERLVTSVMNQGIFHRSVNSARQRLMWLPGLNSGVPLTPRQDPLKEGVYALHNYLHWATIDLIPIGLKNPELFQIYATHRTMGEAITILLSDLFAAEVIRKGSGLSPQDPSSWAIEPVFGELGINPKDESPENFRKIRQLLKAHVDWALKKDERPLRKMFHDSGKTTEKLDDYFNRYRKMFDGDHFWSLKNANAYLEKQNQLEAWWRNTQVVREASTAEFQTPAEMKTRIQTRSGDLVDRLFDEIFENQLLPIMKAKEIPLDSEKVRRGKTLSRYMTGQLAILGEFGHLPEIQKAVSDIKVEIQKLNGVVTDSAGNKILGKYYLLLDILFKKGLINDDDFAVYLSAYPLVTPTFVNTTGK